MEPKYYPIDEETAKRAKSMMSFDEYVMGTKTEEYKTQVDSVYKLANKIVKERPKEAEKVYGLADRFSKRLAENINKNSKIDCMCPSPMIVGPAKFPTQKQEKQVVAREKNYEEYKKIMEMKEKMESILHGKDIIKSDDENAIEKLEEKLKNLKETQETMKEANKAIRMKDAEKSNEKLRNMGYTEEQIKQLREPDFAGRVGYPNYALQNNNANIHRVEERLKKLKATKENGTQEAENPFCKVVENTEAMRLQLIFAGKPSDEIRNVLKSHGFKWAPSQGAWQRQLTENSRYALKQVLKELYEMFPEKKSKEVEEGKNELKKKSNSNANDSNEEEYEMQTYSTATYDAEYFEKLNDTSIESELGGRKKTIEEQRLKVATFVINPDTNSQYFGLKEINENRVLNAPNNWKSEQSAIEWAQKQGYEIVKAEKKVENLQNEKEQIVDAVIRQETIDYIKEHQDFIGLDCSNGIYKNIKFDMAMEQCNFANSKFYNCEFTADVTECNFTNCDMDAEFRLGKVERCNFTGARLEGHAYYEKFLECDFSEAKLQRFRILGESELIKNEWRETVFDGTVLGEDVITKENRFIDSVKFELSDLPDEALEYSKQLRNALNGKEINYSESFVAYSREAARKRASRHLKEFAEKHKSDIANVSGPKKTVVINAFAGAGAGKTTACHMIVAELKKRGYVAEYVSEYAKELVWDKNFELLDGTERSQMKVLEEQLHRMDNKIGQVDFLVTDAPVLLNQIYNNELTDYYKEMLQSIHADYDNFNFFINRNAKEFQQEGRLQNLEESLEKDKQIKDMLAEYGIEYQEYTHQNIEHVVGKIIEYVNPEAEKEQMAAPKSKEISNILNPGELIENDMYQYFVQLFPTVNLSDGHVQITEPQEYVVNSKTGQPEATYPTFVVEGDKYRYCGNCFAGDKEIPDLIQEFKERKVKITNHEFDQEGYLHFQAEVDGYGLEGLYRVSDSVNGSPFTLVSVTDGILHEDIKTEWNQIEQELRDYTKEHLEEYLREQPEMPTMKKAEMVLELKEVDKDIFSLDERNLIMDYAYNTEDFEKTVSLINEMAATEEGRNDVRKKAREEIEKIENNKVEEQRGGENMSDVKTMAGWDKFAEETKKDSIYDYLQVGDAVSEDIVNNFMNIVPPRSMSYGYLQVGTQAGMEINPSTGKMQGTYMTFETDSSTGNYRYCGNCFPGEREETYKTQVIVNAAVEENVTSWQDIEKRWKDLRENKENYSPNEYVIEQMKIEVVEIAYKEQNISRRLEDLEKNMTTYTPDYYDEVKREISALKMEVENQQAEFIESIESINVIEIIESINVSEKEQEKPIGTVEFDGEVTEFFSEAEGLEKYEDAVKMSVTDLEGLLNFDNSYDRWKMTIYEPDKHVLLQYKAEQYFSEVEKREEFTLKDFCEKYKDKMSDVVREVGERLEELNTKRDADKAQAIVNAAVEENAITREEVSETWKNLQENREKYTPEEYRIEQKRAYVLDLKHQEQDIALRWKDLEQDMTTFSPDYYEEKKREIGVLEEVLEDSYKEFVEDIESVNVSERVQEKAIGTVEFDGKAAEFFSESEGLEKYKDASFKLSVEELESLQDFENPRWKMTIYEPDKHVLLQYKAEQYFIGAQKREEFTLKDFCEKYKDKMSDVVREVGERMEELNTNALKVREPVEITNNDQLPPLNNEQIQNILKIIKRDAPTEEVKQLEEIASYISSMEEQLKEVSKQLDFVKGQLSSMKTQNPEVSKLINDTEVLKKHTFNLQEKLQEIKKDFSELIKNVSESIKQTGQSRLNELMKRFKIEEKLEDFQSGLSKLTADITEKQIKIEQIGYELGQAGEHIKNVDKVVSGQIPLNPSENAGTALSNTLTKPLKKAREILDNMNEKTGKSLGKVKNLKKQVEENQKKKEAKKAEKEKEKAKKKEKRKKAIQKRRQQNLER